MFATPVGGAALLGLLFTLVLIYFLSAAIAGGLRKAAAGLRSGVASSTSGPASRRELKIGEYLDAYESWATSGGAEQAPDPSTFGVMSSDWHETDRQRLDELTALSTRVREQFERIRKKKADRLVHVWRRNIADAHARHAAYRLDLGDRRPVLEQHGLTLKDTLEERKLLYEECFEWCKRFNVEYDKAYQRAHAPAPTGPTVPLYPSTEELDHWTEAYPERPQPPRLEDFWLRRSAVGSIISAEPVLSPSSPAPPESGGTVTYPAISPSPTAKGASNRSITSTTRRHPGWTAFALILVCSVVSALVLGGAAHATGQATIALVFLAITVVAPLVWSTIRIISESR